MFGVTTQARNDDESRWDSGIEIVNVHSWYQLVHLDSFCIVRAIQENKSAYYNHCIRPGCLSESCSPQTPVLAR